MNLSIRNKAVKGKQKKPFCGLVLCEWKDCRKVGNTM